MKNKGLRWEYAKTLLSDRHSVWCAWCLAYIDSVGDLEIHHVLNKSKLRKTFGIESWVVPVHRTYCHRKGLQDFADEAARELQHAASPDCGQFEAICRKHFEIGNLPSSFILRRYALANAKDSVQARQHLLFALNAAAGCGIGLRSINELVRSQALDSFADDLDVKVYYAAALGNAGEHSRALEIADFLAANIARVRPASSVTYAKLIRMTASLRPTLKRTNEALRVARDSADSYYNGYTSQLACASALELQKDYITARDVAIKLSDLNEMRRPSWWHAVQQDALWARTVTFSEKPPRFNSVIRNAIKAACRAQYAGALLNLRGHPIADFRLTGASPKLANLGPATLVDWIGEKFSISKDQMTELRCEAILGKSSPRNEDELLPLHFQGKVLATIRYRDNLSAVNLATPIA